MIGYIDTTAINEIWILIRSVTECARHHQIDETQYSFKTNRMDIVFFAIFITCLYSYLKNKGNVCVGTYQKNKQIESCTYTHKHIYSVHTSCYGKCNTIIFSITCSEFY